MKISHKILNEMGRTRSEAIEKWFALDQTIIEHLFKLYAFHKERPNDVKGWLKSLNKHLPILRRFNISKTSKKNNLPREWFISNLVESDFESKKELTLYASHFEDKGFPKFKPKQSDVKKIQKLAKEFVELIFTEKGQLEYDPKKLS